MCVRRACNGRCSPPRPPRRPVRCGSFEELFLVSEPCCRVSGEGHAVRRGRGRSASFTFAKSERYGVILTRPHSEASFGGLVWKFLTIAVSRQTHEIAFPLRALLRSSSCSLASQGKLFPWSVFPFRTSESAQGNEIQWICAINRGATGAVFLLAGIRREEQAERPCFPRTRRNRPAGKGSARFPYSVLRLGRGANLPRHHPNARGDQRTRSSCWSRPSWSSSSHLSRRGGQSPRLLGCSGSEGNRTSGTQVQRTTTKCDMRQSPNKRRRGYGGGARRIGDGLWYRTSVPPKLPISE